MSEIKFLAYYLPAFHEIEENNMWYGKGFTEWNNTKKACKLFDGHYQPRIPLDYYDLSDISKVKQQMDYAKKYSVDGFVYYHYWFNGDGYKILNGPAEQLLKLDQSERIEFCFAWANESWRKTWHDGPGKSELLIEQQYGGEPDWRNHFEYLLPFFNDSKYIKVNGAPMILIYKAENIPDYEKMIECWTELAIDNGFSGIHVVRMLTNKNAEKTKLTCSAVVDFEPSYTLGCDIRRNRFPLWRLRHMLYRRTNHFELISKHFLDTIDYDAFYKTLLSKQPKEPKQYLSLFNDWDNSPRKGKRGTIFVGSSPEKFEKYLFEIAKQTVRLDTRFIFCFAWNEWGEGGYLEPDKKFGFRYLSAIKRVKNKLEK